MLLQELYNKQDIASLTTSSRLYFSGIGWYVPEVERKDGDVFPGVYTSISPAWNDANLERITPKIVSPLIFAHVRAAMVGTPVVQMKCHVSHIIWTEVSVRRRKAAHNLCYSQVFEFHSCHWVNFASIGESASLTTLSIFHSFISRLYYVQAKYVKSHPFSVGRYEIHNSEIAGSKVCLSYGAFLCSPSKS